MTLYRLGASIRVDGSESRKIADIVEKSGYRHARTTSDPSAVLNTLEWWFLWERPL
jgi:hypothetical protein